ncbi:MAG: hypothetical protein J5827_03980, partial [Oscillospiraceae bacterium]|nr:hypothetical protein [Oscillospiraceae bacterium]
MKKFAVFSGFLGSGKTTAMTALTRYCSSQGVSAAMISNDLGAGVELADDRFARLSGCRAAQITDECICYCGGVLEDRLNSFYEDGCELVISDIPGFGVGALEHVYLRPLGDPSSGFELAPFTVITEPRNVKTLFGDKGGDMSHIMDAQLKEADLIVLNKCDLISPSEADRLVKQLASRFPEAAVVAVSAARGDGLDRLAEALLRGRASMRRPDIDYGDERLIAEMDSLTEYYIQYRAEVCCDDFDGT